MQVSGFTILRNVSKYHYPWKESIVSILPICDEFVINVGHSDDDTLSAVEAFARREGTKVRIMPSAWDMAMGKTVLSEQTNLALKACRGDWAFYLQADEVIHEADLSRIKSVMQRYLSDLSVDALQFRWLHFFGSYFRYRIDQGWYQKQDRIIRNNGAVRSFGDAFGFERADGRPLRRRETGCLLYHYGWVQDPEVMTQRRINAEKIGFTALSAGERQTGYAYGDLKRFPPYFGSHPSVMKDFVAGHELSRADLKDIQRRYWWHPMRMLKARYKTGRRVKERL